jgi:hypothetical protein
VLVDRALVAAHVLVRRVGIQVEAVQVRVERRELVVVGALDRDRSQLAVPLRPRAALDVVERLAGDLELEVVLGLLDADQRRGDPHRDGARRAVVELRIAG